MKSNVLCALLASVFVLSLTACGGGSVAGPTPVTTVPPAITSVTVLGATPKSGTEVHYDETIVIAAECVLLRGYPGELLVVSANLSVNGDESILDSGGGTGVFYPTPPVGAYTDNVVVNVRLPVSYRGKINETGFVNARLERWAGPGGPVLEVLAQTRAELRFSYK